MKESSELEMLRSFKEKSGWSYDKMSKIIGVHSQTVQGWFSGKNLPSQLAKKAIRNFIIDHLE